MRKDRFWIDRTNVTSIPNKSFELLLKISCGCLELLQAAPAPLTDRQIRETIKPQSTTFCQANILTIHKQSIHRYAQFMHIYIYIYMLGPSP